MYRSRPLGDPLPLGSGSQLRSVVVRSASASSSKARPDIEKFLNGEGEKGWRLHQIVTPATANFGQSDKMIAILEREKKT